MQQTIRTRGKGAPVKPGPRTGLIETGPQSREQLLGAALRVSLALDRKILILKTDKQPSLQDVLRKVAGKGAEQGIGLGEELRGLRTVPASILQRDINTIADAGRRQQEEMPKILGKKLGSEFITSVCLQIHILQAQIPQLLGVEEMGAVVGKQGAV